MSFCWFKGQCSLKTRAPKKKADTDTGIDIQAYKFILLLVFVISMYKLAACFLCCGMVIVYLNGPCSCLKN